MKSKSRSDVKKGGTQRQSEKKPWPRVENRLKQISVPTLNEEDICNLGTEFGKKARLR